MKTERELYQEHYKTSRDYKFYVKHEMTEKQIFEFRNGKYSVDCVNDGWKIWQASASRDGYKLLPVKDINEFYQDDNEPEIFCERESDFDSLGDCTELDEIMTVNKYTSARLKKETLYGVWCKCEKKAPYFKETEFKLFSNKDDARKAMIGATE